MSRRTLFGLVAVFIVVVLAACSGSGFSRGAKSAPKGETAAAKDARGSGGSKPEPKLLFAARGAATVNGDQLTVVTGTTPVTWITDRPDRVAGHITAPAFVAGWKPAGFESDPPNAVLLSGDHSTSVELTAPSWDAANAALRFTVTPLHGDRLSAGDLGPAELFIDDANAGYYSAHQIASIPQTQFVR